MLDIKLVDRLNEIADFDQDGGIQVNVEGIGVDLSTYIEHPKKAEIKTTDYYLVIAHYGRIKLDKIVFTDFEEDAEMKKLTIKTENLHLTFAGYQL